MASKLTEKPPPPGAGPGPAPKPPGDPGAGCGAWPWPPLAGTALEPPAALTSALTSCSPGVTDAELGKPRTGASTLATSARPGSLDGSAGAGTAPTDGVAGGESASGNGPGAWVGVTAV